MNISHTLLFPWMQTCLTIDRNPTQSGALRLRVNNHNKVALSMTLLLLGMLSGFARGEVTFVSANSTGVDGNSDSDYPSISADGRFVAFSSRANNLVTDDVNDWNDVFLKNVETGEIVLVSMDALGNGGTNFGARPSISADGQFVAFVSPTNYVSENTNGLNDVLRKNVETGEIMRVSEDSVGARGNGISGGTSISADGQFVAFWSSATNLVPEDTNGSVDVFRKNMGTGEVVQVSDDTRGEFLGGSSGSPSISADGRFVAFESSAINLSPEDMNGENHVFVKNVETSEIFRVSEDAAGGPGNHYSGNPHISADGRFVVFESEASNLVPGDTNDYSDVFVKNIETSEIVRVSEDARGNQGKGHSDGASISANGRFVTFRSIANNLVPGDNCNGDVFVKNVETGEIVRVSEGPGGVQADLSSNFPSISADGRRVAFQSFAYNLVAEHMSTNSQSSVFLADVVWPPASTLLLKLRYVVYSDAAAEVFWDRFPNNRNVVYELTRNGELMGVLDALSVFEDNLEQGTQYTYTVTVIDNNGNRLATDTVGFTTNCFEPLRVSDPVNPSRPENLTFAVYSDTAAEIFWDPSSDDGYVQGYEILRNGAYIGIFDVLSVFDDDLAPGMTYTYTITAIDNDGGRSSTSSIQLSTGEKNPGSSSLPSSPSLRVAVYSNTAAELFWNRSTDDGLVIGYEVSRNGESRGILDILSVFDDDLTPGVDYLYQITAVDNEGNRSVSSSIRVTSGDPVTPDDRPAPPNGLRAALYSSTAAELFWERSILPGLRYEIERDGDVLATTNGTSHFDGSLLPGIQRFEYAVVTIDKNDRRSIAAIITLDRD